jgi:hypothetical protein
MFPVLLQIRHELRRIVSSASRFPPALANIMALTLVSAARA